VARDLCDAGQRRKRSRLRGSAANPYGFLAAPWIAHAFRLTMRIEALLHSVPTWSVAFTRFRPM
jgi:hypothetical protein